MRNNIIILGIALFLVSSTLLKAQNSVNTIFLKGVFTAQTLEEEGLEIVRIEYDIISNSSKQKLTVRRFSPNYKYYVLGFTDESIEGFKMNLYREMDDEWQVTQTKNSDENSIAIMEFDPPAAETFPVQFTVTDFANGANAGYFGIIVAHTLESSEENSGIANDDGNKSQDFKVLNISCSGKKVGVMKGDDFKVLSETEESSLFKLNANMDVITHKTTEVTSTYYVKNMEELDNENAWDYKFDVTSDVGNEYVFLLSDGNLTIIGEKDEQAYVIVWNIKSSWKE